MKSRTFQAQGKKAPRFVAAFDSTTGMVRALGRYLEGKDFPGLGGTAPTSETLAALVNALPKVVREQLYIWSGAFEAIPAKQLGDVRAEELSRWVANSYPKRRYPAAMIGSSNGALVHLYAALGVPWLPQTFLIPVRRTGVHPDEPKQDLEWGVQHAAPLLEANPELQLHHMHDANQDRLMIQRMTYFRVKRLRLGEIYRRFLEENLAPGATIFLVECGLSWPTLQVGERHIFQMGALGGATPDEFLYGNERVASYLERYRSHRREWEQPQSDGERPEAEWGFEPSLREEVAQLAKDRGYHLQRIVFEQPEDVSPLVADLYCWWYEQRGLPGNRLLVESFILMEPYWALHTGSVPFWMVFNMEPSLQRVHEYLDGAEPFDEIYLMLFAHGVESVGLAKIEEWETVLRRARRHCSFIGVDPPKFPRDFGVYARYYPHIKKRIRGRYPLPEPMTFDQFGQFLKQSKGRYKVQWLGES